MPVQSLPLRRLGKTDLELTALGFGAWAIGGGDWALGWGPQDDVESIAAIHRALDAGMNWIDTAPIYGLGHSEKVIGQALQERQDHPILATKCGRTEDPEGFLGLGTNLTRDAILRELEQSLALLGVSSVDMYLIHWPDDNLEEAWATLVDLKSEGLTRTIGVSNFTLEQMRFVQAIAPIDVCEPPYSLINRAIEAEILPFCEQEGIGVLAYAPLAGGILTGTMTRDRFAALPKDDWRVSLKLPQFQEPEFSLHLALVEVLREIGGRHGCSPGETAVAWVLRQQAVTSAIVGLRRPEQVDGLIRGATLELDLEELAEIEAFFSETRADDLA
jgi:aryl-alcohol dehydrogenase-like predicted oxidoreductase